jgi:hypothetical protein
MKSRALNTAPIPVVRPAVETVEEVPTVKVETQTKKKTAKKKIKTSRKY